MPLASKPEQQRTVPQTDRDALIERRRRNCVSQTINSPEHQPQANHRALTERRRRSREPGPT
jgi:hypothetical protein